MYAEFYEQKKFWEVQQEVHISNIYAREKFRKQSLLSPNCKAVLCGLGLDSYKAALLTLK